MTPVVQIFSVYIIVFCILPSGRLHLTDALTLFRRHEVHSDSGACSTASAQPVQFTVKFIGLSGQIIFWKIWLIVIDCNVCLIRICRHILQRKICSRPLSGQFLRIRMFFCWRPGSIIPGRSLLQRILCLIGCRFFCYGSLQYLSGTLRLRFSTCRHRQNGRQCSRQ